MSRFGPVDNVIGIFEGLQGISLRTMMTLSARSTNAAEGAGCRSRVAAASASLALELAGVYDRSAMFNFKFAVVSLLITSFACVV
jgi:hypothetical protein